ncbi:uncharacterized protein FA14DRAFT_190386 [Meira miltonrushii]|uniref:CUE domain-containing protein n=1 Tax=Meira miltonrushii TaxID=1280837 RepID=A0A316V860_9BASI|nr:uncharacterized protein FA14DRAFT_190386 [Meira miltonrushii]PWN33218.1 hypothetical protein FA14DRAFT_190386 [Meira miltonrushii]
MNPNSSPSTPGGAKSIFDQYAFDTRSQHSDHSAPFESVSNSRRPSAQPNTVGESPSIPFDHMMTNVHQDNNGSPSNENNGESSYAAETQSIRSTSSSLRDAYAALKGGIFPPGVRSKRQIGEDDDESDASQYDEDGYSFEGEGPFQKPDSPIKPTMDANADPSHDVYTNALDSPDVPLRRSSVLDSPVVATSSLRHSVDQSSASTSNSGVSKSKGSLNKETTAHDSVTSPNDHSRTGSIASKTSNKKSMHTRHQPSIGESPDENSASIKGSPSLEQESENVKHHEAPAGMSEEEWQRQHEASAAADPNRPRTLKEARALAKERARMRLMQTKGPGETASPPATLGSTTISPPSTNDEVEDRSPSLDSKHRQEHRHAQVIPLPAEAKHDAAVVKPTLDDSDSLTGTKSALVDMTDLQAAVGEALEDVSFTSSATSATATGKFGDLERTPIIGSVEASRDTASARLDGSATHSQRQGIPLSVPSDVDMESVTHSVTSFDSAPESPSSRASPYVSAANLPGSPAPVHYSDATEVQPPVIPVIQAADHFKQPSAFATAASSPRQQQQASFIPHAMRSQQRSTAPNKIARLDVYGKTVPWPAAFEPAAIIEQKRLAPWERARSYAYYCNDLMNTPTGVMIWLEMVQRPAQRAAAAAANSTIKQIHGTPNKRHLRAEGTDGSGYAASVRSDATFPMRGDGGKAKEIVSHHPSEAAIPESPTALPQSLPYPMLAGANSTSSPSIRHQTRPSQEGFYNSNFPSSTSFGDKREPRNFFSNLGRKSSMRKTQGTGIGLSSLNSNSPSKNVMSSIRSRGISNPAPTTGSSPKIKTIPIAGSQSVDQSVISPSSAAYSPTLVSSPDMSSQHSVGTPLTSKGSDLHSQSESSHSRGPQGPRALGNAPSYFGSLGSGMGHRSDSVPSIRTINHEEGKTGLHGLSTTGGIYSIPGNGGSSSHLNAPTDYSANSSPTMAGGNGQSDRRSPRSNQQSLPALTNVKNSLSYQSVRDPNRRPTQPSLQPPLRSTSAHSSDSHSSSISHNNSNNNLTAGGNGTVAGGFSLGRRRSSNLAPSMTPGESEALDKLCDVLPDADRTTLLDYLRRANGNDLVAIGDYLQDQSKVEQSRRMR